MQTSPHSAETADATSTLYERLGGRDAIAKIAKDIFDLHLQNSKIRPRYVNSDYDRVVRLVSEFLWSATGGPQEYTGRDMTAIHTGMNINDEEFNAVLDDILAALDKNNVGEQEKRELLMASYGLKSEIVRL